ncbi:hypothetical protein ACFSUK_22940 [Sphingobium scionense]
MTDPAGQAMAIANLKARYCAAADLAAQAPDRARALFADIFTDDFVGDYGLTPLLGAARSSISSAPLSPETANGCCICSIRPGSRLTGTVQLVTGPCWSS